MPDQEDETLLIDKHASFLKRILLVLPGSSAPYDNQRVTLAYFSVSGLDVLNRLHLIDDMRESIIEWIYSNLINCDIDDNRYGFRGSSTFKLDSSDRPTNIHDYPHITMTYTALATLVILGDDLSRINGELISKGMRDLQLEDGSFQASAEGGENDMRFLYCAAAITSFIDSKAGIDVEKAINYVINSLSYEGAFGQGPWLEAHGGSTYCAVAALSLLGGLDRLPERKIESLVRWCVSKQISGFQGRPNKPEDTCYTFWLGATLKMLGFANCIDWPEIQKFILTTQDPITGGLARSSDICPDPLHTYLGLSGLSLAEPVLSPQLQIVDPALNISLRAKKHLESIHNQNES